MSPVSVALFIIGLLAMNAADAASQPNSIQDPNEILRNSINTAAGMELIPKDTQFKLKTLNGVSSSKCTDFPGGGKGCVYNTVYATKGSSGSAEGAVFASSVAARVPSLSLSIFTYLALAPFFGFLVQALHRF